MAHKVPDGLVYCGGMSRRYHEALKAAGIPVWNTNEWVQANMAVGPPTEVAPLWAPEWVRKGIVDYEEIKKKAALDGIPSSSSEEGPSLLVAALTGMKPNEN